MKTKLTLMVDRAIIEKAKREASNQGISLSNLFEKLFEEKTPTLAKSPAQLAAARFLKRLKEMEPTQSTEETDKEARGRYLREKYAYNLNWQFPKEFFAS